MIVKVLIKSFNFIRLLLYKLPPAMNGHLARIYKDLYMELVGSKGEERLMHHLEIWKKRERNLGFGGTMICAFLL